MDYFREPLLHYIRKRGWIPNRETDQKDVCMEIRKGSQAVIAFVADSIEEMDSVHLTLDPREPSTGAVSDVGKRPESSI